MSVMLAVNYAFSGTELIGIAAGETDNPKEAVPRAIKTTIGRLVIFFVLTIVVLASLLPMKEAGVSSAPFVDVFDKMGIPFAADIMNFVILTAILLLEIQDFMRQAVCCGLWPMRECSIKS